MKNDPLPSEKQGTPPPYHYHRQTPEASAHRAGGGDGPDRLKPEIIINIPNFRATMRVLLTVMGTLGVIALVAAFLITKYWSVQEARTARLSQMESQRDRPPPPVIEPIYVPGEKTPEPPRPYPIGDGAAARYLDTYAVWSQLEQPWRHAGRVFMLATNHAAAQIAFELALQDQRETPALLTDLGVCCLRQQKISPAVDYFLQAVAADPALPEPYYHLAICYLTRQEPMRAWFYLQQHLELDPEHTDALQLKAEMEILYRRYAEALTTLRQAIALEPGKSTLYFRAAAVAALLKQPEQAISFLEPTLKLEPPSTVFRVYQDTTFRDVRVSEWGAAFERKLAEAARARLRVP